MTEKKLTRQQAWRKRNPRSYLAHLATANALRLGIIAKQPCEICGAEIVDAHHSDYSRPFDVTWLCRRHHRELHAGGAGR